MNTKKTWITVLVITTLIIVIFTMISKKNNPSEPITTSTKNLVHTLTYACDAKRSMIVQYYELPPTEHNRSQTSSGQPSPTGSVTLSLSDGRSIYLAQTVSANGARYANANESIVFWSKGNGFTFTEKNIETYPGCIEVARASNGLSEIYESSTRGFSVRYPVGFTVDDAYSYQNLGPGKNIVGVKFTIPASLASGTNLSNDSYVSVERLPKATSCNATMFLSQHGMASNVISNITEGDITYSVASTSDAGAGNRYEEMVYALPGTSPCVAVRYFVHYGAFENYPAGTTQEFNKPLLLSTFDSIRHTLILSH